MMKDRPVLQPRAIAAFALLTVAALWWTAKNPAARDPGELMAGPPPRGGEVVVAGEWLAWSPSPNGRLLVNLRGGVVCHFDLADTADRSELLQARLRRHDVVTVRGRFDGAEHGCAILRNCRLLD